MAAHSSYFLRFSPTVLVDWRTALPEDEMDAAAADKKDKIFVKISFKINKKDKIFVNIGIKINKKSKSLSTSASRSSISASRSLSAFTSISTSAPPSTITSR